MKSKTKVHFFCPPPSLKSGSDVVGMRTAEEMRRIGVDSRCGYLSSELLAEKFGLSGSRVVRKVHKELLSSIGINRLLSDIRNGDIVWMNDFARGKKPLDVHFEKSLRQRGAKYVLHLQDNWLDAPNKSPGVRARMEIADLVVVVSHELKRQVLKHYPNVRTVFLEEPIDVDRVRPVVWGASPEVPVLLWTGNPGNLTSHFPELIDALKKVYNKFPFVLRVVSGASQPCLNFPFPVEWRPYSLEKESENLAGALAGLAPLEDSLYARCKDVYKVKTYMAAGVVPLASGIGHCLEVIKHGETGFMFNSSDEWVSGLCRLLENPVLVDSMGASARKDCVERFSHKALIPAWRDTLWENLEMEQTI